MAEYAVEFVSLEELFWELVATKHSKQAHSIEGLRFTIEVIYHLQTVCLSMEIEASKIQILKEKQRQTQSAFITITALQH